MTIDVYTATGTKKGTATLPKSLFEAPVNHGLMHQFTMLQQSNRRHAIAHTKSRGEISGSTRKLFAQKGTGRARRGSVRSPVLRGGNKAFGPNKNANFTKDMPQKMRRAALISCLSAQATNGAILGLENYPEEMQTKKAKQLLEKLPVELGRKIIIVVSEKHSHLLLSTRNIPRVKVVLVNYLNPEDILGSNHIIFMTDALKKAEEIFGGATKASEVEPKKLSAEEAKKPATKKPTAKKPTTKKPTPAKK